jgi:hypothetical protein
VRRSGGKRSAEWCGKYTYGRQDAAERETQSIAMLGIRVVVVRCVVMWVMVVMMLWGERDWMLDLGGL